jgi:hypothetical protein
MITKLEFITYCFDVRKSNGTLPHHQTFEYIHNWILGHNNEPLAYIFRVIGLWNGRYDGEFKYPELSDIKFSELPDEVPSTLSYLEILDKL